jgi:uncharacterized membrane protein YdbT with pleckstrin-like domain
MEEEKAVWEGNPSQLLNFHIYLLCLVVAAALLFVAFQFRENLGPTGAYAVAGAAAIPLIFAFIKWLQIRFRRYELTTERLRLRRGILSRNTDELELYRIKDYVLHEPFFLRVFGKGNIALTTTDDANPNVVLQAVPRAESLRDEIRKYVEIRREAKRVRITEFE